MATRHRSVDVLVTGGAGFIGTHTVLALLAAGQSVRVVDALRQPVHADQRPPSWFPSADVELIKGDVRDRETMAKAVQGVERVLHLAAYQDYLTDFSTFFSINTAGTAMLYEVALEQKVDLQRIVIASSQAVYGEGRYLCEEHGQFAAKPRSQAALGAGSWEVVCPLCSAPATPIASSEDWVEPGNPYGVSKLTQEQVGRVLGDRYALPTTCLRYSITQGRYQSPSNAYSGVCRLFCTRVLCGKPPVIFEDGAQRRDYVAVSDVVQANLLALRDEGMIGSSYNVGGPDVLSVAEYARIVCDVLGVDLVPQVPGIYRFGDTRNSISSSAKLREHGWAPVGTVASTIADFTEWLQGQELIDDVSDETNEMMARLGVLRQAQ